MKITKYKTKLLVTTCLVAAFFENAALAQDGTGFVLTLDGVTVSEDPQIVDEVRRTDVALEKANVQVTYDGLDVKPRLDLELLSDRNKNVAGDIVELSSTSNYPAFIERGEILIYDRGAAQGDRLVESISLNPNERTSIKLPDGKNLVAVYRVYDVRGRFDESRPLSLMVRDDRGLDQDAEDGSDNTARRSIPVSGGAVTVSATGMTPNSYLDVFETSVPADRSGKAVIQRILPPGDYGVAVSINQFGAPVELTRDVTIPRSEWFYVGLADLTYYRERERDSGKGWDERGTGRLAYYVDGKTASGAEITSSLDTREQDIDDVFRRLDKRDPLSALERIDPQDTYPTFGDDSTSQDNTPTSGAFYLRVEQDGNYLLWGDSRSQLNGSAFLRNERTLYGAKLHLESAKRTTQGEARLSLDAYASQPDQAVGRDILRGTSGSVYFLSRQDITTGTATLTVESRDRTSGRIVDQLVLIEGRDYNINHLSGVVTLRQPLNGYVNSGRVITPAGGDVVVNLVAQYEYSATNGQDNEWAYGGRIEGWVSDNVRLGYTGLADDSAMDDYQAQALDLRYRFGENSFVQFDYAESEGSLPGRRSSLNAGLTLDEETPVTSGEGSATKVEIVADLKDFGLQRDGAFSAYYETRDEGFSSLDTVVPANRGNETLYGFDLHVPMTERIGYRLYGDMYENKSGDQNSRYGAELETRVSPVLRFTAALEQVGQRIDNGPKDSRTDGAVRLSYQPSDDFGVWAFAQGTLQKQGLQEYNRLGIGARQKFANGWALEGEISDGTGGLGGRALARYAKDANDSYYAGYELDPGRAFDASISSDDNGGKFILGARKKINSDVTYFGENVYDIFDSERSLTSVYGVEYQRHDALTYEAGFSFGEIDDDEGNRFERRAASMGVRYEDETLRGRLRLEYSEDIGQGTQIDRSGQTYALLGDVRYEFSEESRLLGSLDYLLSNSDQDRIEDGEYTDFTLGYAYRPISNEKLNVLARYRFHHDTIGQTVNDADNDRIRQKTHVFSLEGSYDLNEQWTLGTKIGGRLSEVSTEAGYESNNAILGVANLRWHMVKNWDLLIEGRMLDTETAGREVGTLVSVYRHIGDNVKLGVGYNFTSFSDDLTDQTRDDDGIFINLVAKF